MNHDLQRERFRQQMTRAQLARSTKLTPKTLVAVEERRTKVRLDTAARIAKALDCEVHELFRAEEVIG